MSDAIPAEGPRWPDDDQTPVFMDFEEPKKPARKKKKAKKSKRPTEEAIPRLPDRPVLKVATGGVSIRAQACVNMRLEGASFLEIAQSLEYESPEDARNEYQRTLAKTHSSDDWESLRTAEGARALKLFQNSLRMSQAEYLIVDDGEGGEKRVPNRDRLGWHRQAGIDLMNHATITGAKAPTKIEITPEDAQLDKIVSFLADRALEGEAVEADVLELTVMPEDMEDLDRDD